jgi:hypothetical protein
MPMDERKRLSENRQYDVHNHADAGGGAMGGRGLTIGLLAVVGVFVVLIVLLLR